MKRRITALMMAAAMCMSLVACGGSNTNTTENNNTAESGSAAAKDTSDLKIGLVTDVGGVNDGSFNQTAWEGMERAAEELGVTTGTGAFMKTVDQSIELAKLMVSIGTHHGRRMAAMITDMDTPLGHNIGNSLEVMESMDVLKGHGPADLTEVCLQLAAKMLVLAGKGAPAECRAMAQAVIADGSAFAKCKEMFAAQGGDTRVLDDYSLFEQPAARYELLAEQDGYIVANDAEKIGSASVLLGAGRQKKGDPLDFAAGITLHKKRGDYVHKGESLATFYGAADKFEAAAAEYRSGLVYGAEKPEEAPLVYALVTKDGVERY